LDKGISGKVLIDFVVDTAGKVSNISCPNADKQHPDLIDEAIRVVKLTNGQWTPASNNGKPVKAKMRLPIFFEIE
jgi:TonB family protein